MSHHVLFALSPTQKERLPSVSAFYFNEHDIERLGFTLVKDLDQLNGLKKDILSGKPEHALAHIEVREYYEICEDSKCIDIAYELDKAEALLKKAKEKGHGETYILKCFEPKRSATVKLIQ